MKARGQVVADADLLLLMFQGYKPNPDRSLHAYYQRKKDAFEEGERVPSTAVMTNMQNKYIKHLNSKVLENTTTSI